MGDTNDIPLAENEHEKGDEGRLTESDEQSAEEGKEQRAG